VANIWTISCDNSETVQIRCQLVLITNSKSHTGFRLIPYSMTLNDLERRDSPYFAFFSPNPIALLASYVTVVEIKYCIPIPVFHFWPKLTHPAARSLCDCWATCWRFIAVLLSTVSYIIEFTGHSFSDRDSSTGTTAPRPSTGAPSLDLARAFRPPDPLWLLPSPGTNL